MNANGYQASQIISLRPGTNSIAILSMTMGLQVLRSIYLTFISTEAIISVNIWSFVFFNIWIQHYIFLFLFPNSQKKLTPYLTWFNAHSKDIDMMFKRRCCGWTAGIRAISWEWESRDSIWSPHRGLALWHKGTGRKHLDVPGIAFLYEIFDDQAPYVLINWASGIRFC